MNTFESWKHTFHNWPSNLPRSGVLIVEGDTILYGDFRVNDSMIIVDRKNPDAMGARKVMVHFSDIRGVKFVDVLDLDRFESLGFVTGKPTQPPQKVDTMKETGTARQALAALARTQTPNPAPGEKLTASASAVAAAVGAAKSQ